ncbi:MAG: hypothetical protein LBD16_09650 [Oscillospiraceae bacterium]|jgi:hypothetical protein|nr:hypothetical protein [Oscillospiraceae bacterium]
MKRSELKNAFAPMPNDCYQALTTATRRIYESKEDIVVKKKFSVALAVALVLVLLGGIALAVSSWRDAARQIVVNEQADGPYENWPTAKKAALVRAIVDQGFMQKTKEIDDLLNDKLTLGQADKVANETLVAFTGLEVSEISFMIIMEGAWGPFSQWTLEEQAWYSRLMADTGLQGDDHTLYVMPENPAIDEAEAIAIARREIAEGFGVPEETLDGYTLTVAYQVPELAFEGDEPNQPYWYVCYEAPSDMSADSRLFTMFELFVNSETGELPYTVESQLAARDEWETYLNDSLIKEIQQFGDDHGVYWEGMSVESKALWSETLRPKILAKLAVDPDFFRSIQMEAMVAFIYGTPDETALIQDQAMKLAENVLIETFNRKPDEIRFYTAIVDTYYDVTNPDKPLWKFFFRAPRLWGNAEAIAYYGDPSEIDGKIRTVNYKVEIDARTGELVTAFEVEMKDVETVEDWMKMM